MCAANLDEVVGIETASYEFPWTRGNFADALANANEGWVLRAEDGRMLGYFLLMMAVDEAHLLNITVAPTARNQGLCLEMLHAANRLARAQGMTSMLLEVRPSNQRAIDIYQRHGYARIGMRKAYYPAPRAQREDAIVMRLPL
jgi:ribosomal-protein-alanine N-acetyltransferase